MQDADFHTVQLANILNSVIEQYTAENKDCDVNDILSALCLMLVAECRGQEIPRIEVLRNVAMMYDGGNAETMN